MLWTSLCYFLVCYAFDQWLRPSYKINGTGYVRSSPILTATWWHSQHSKDAFLTWDVQISLDLWTSKHKHICNNTPNPLSTLYVNVLYLHRKLLFMGSRCLFFSPKNLDYRPLVDSFRLPSSFGTNSSLVLNCGSNRYIILSKSRATIYVLCFSLFFWPKIFLEIQIMLVYKYKLVWLHSTIPSDMMKIIVGCIK